MLHQATYIILTTDMGTVFQSAPKGYCPAICNNLPLKVDSDIQYSVLSLLQPSNVCQDLQLYGDIFSSLLSANICS